MIGQKNAPAPSLDAEGETNTDLAGGLIESNDTATVKLPTPCVMACSLPTGSCQYRCPLQAVAS